MQPAGRLTGVFGIRGELKCVPTPLGADAFVPGGSFTYRLRGEQGVLRCTSARRHHARLLVAFAGIADPEQASSLVGAELSIDRPAMPLGPDEYLDSELIGLRLLDDATADNRLRAPSPPPE